MCKKSESIKEIAIALCKFNAEVKTVEKDSVNPHFKNKYASLDNIIEDVKPLLAKHGLSFLQMAGGDGERLTMSTLLMHTSGEWIESEPLIMRPAKNDPQGMGSASTYARRYSLSAFLGIATGEDDDGNASTPPPSVQRQQPTQTPPREPQSPTSQDSVLSNAVSSAQMGMIAKVKKDKGIDDEAYRRMLAGFSVTSTKDLTKQSASQVIKMLQEYVAPEPEPEPLPF